MTLQPASSAFGTSSSEVSIGVTRKTTSLSWKTSAGFLSVSFKSFSGSAVACGCFPFSSASKRASARQARTVKVFSRVRLRRNQILRLLKLPALHSFVCTVFGADVVCQLRLQAPQFDEARRGVLVEQASLFVGGQVEVVKRVRRRAPDYFRASLEELELDFPANFFVRLVDERVEPA